MLHSTNYGICKEYKLGQIKARKWWFSRDPDLGVVLVVNCKDNLSICVNIKERIVVKTYITHVIVNSNQHAKIYRNTIIHVILFLDET